MAVKATNKKPLSGNRRSHSCRATKHMQKVNLQKVTLEDVIEVAQGVTIDTIYFLKN